MIMQGRREGTLRPTQPSSIGRAVTKGLRTSKGVAWQSKPGARLTGSITTMNE
jgi:hypothetical protein